MATAKIDDQLSFELEEGEFVLFADVPRMERIYKPEGAWYIKLLIPKGLYQFFTMKSWAANMAITNKRVVVVPKLPNKKNFPMESFYFTEIEGAKANTRDGFYHRSYFWILTKLKGDAKWKDIIIGMEGTLNNVMKSLGDAFDFSEAVAVCGGAFDYAYHQSKFNSAASYDEAQAIKASWEKVSAEYDKMYKEATKKNQDAAHFVKRDFLVAMINQCVAAVNKG